MRFLRHGLPALICLVGLVWGAVRNMDDLGIEIAVLLVAAGSSLWLVTWLFRLGITTDSDRDREEDARRFFDEHGHWPDEAPPAR